MVGEEANPQDHVNTTADRVYLVVSPQRIYRVDFGDIVPPDPGAAFIYGTVFNDADSNGVQSFGEIGLRGVTVSHGGPLSGTTRTDGYGRYTFRVTSEGAYAVWETDPIPYASTTNYTVEVNPVLLERPYEVNFGDVFISPTPGIYGVVFNDLDGDGSRDADEPGIGDVNIEIAGAVASNTTSGADGFYWFDDIPSGSYSVNETNLAGSVSTTADMVVVITTNSAASADFGDIFPRPDPFAWVYGTVFDDLDADGVQELGETGIEGVKVSVAGPTDGEAWTSANGGYTFKMAAPGSYTLTETDPPAYYSRTGNVFSVSVLPVVSYQRDFADTPLATCSLVLTPKAASNQLPGDTSESFTVTIMDQHGVGLGGVAVAFATTFGAVSPSSGITGQTGDANSVVSSSAAGSGTVRGSAGPLSDSAVVSWLPPSTPPWTSPTPIPTTTPTPTPTRTPTPRPSGEVAYYFTVDFAGRITTGYASAGGQLLDSMDALSPDDRSAIHLEKGTRMTDAEGEVVTLIRVTEATELPELPPYASLLGKAYELSPSGASFNIPIKLALGYDVKQLPIVVDSLMLGRYEPETGWESLDVEADVVAGLGTLTAQVEHFSIFAVLAKTTGASFKTGNLVVTPTVKKYWSILPLVTIEARQLTITAEVTNTGGQRGVYRFVLTLDGEAVQEQFVPLEPLETQTLTFTLAGLPNGKHSVQLGSLSQEFQSVFLIRWWLLIVLALVVAFLLWLWYRFAFR